MSASDVLFQNLMSKNFLDSSDDETEAWTTSSGSSNQSSESSEGGIVQSTIKGEPNFHVFGDYFGLSNLLQNVQLSQGNPYFSSDCSKGDVFYRAGRNRRLSWESDTSDPNAVISPTLDSAPYNYSNLAGDYGSGQVQQHHSHHHNVSHSDTTRLQQQQQQYDCGFKQLPPPSMRLSKAVRDQIINGSYHHYPMSSSHQQQQQQQYMNRRDDTKLLAPRLPLSQQHRPPQTSHIGGSQVSPIGGVAVNGGGGQPMMHSRSMQPQQQQQVCVFCRNNGESEAVYSSHVLKDTEGRTACPILRAYTCPICKANGDNSHTIKYCPLNQHNGNPTNNGRSTSGGGGSLIPPMPAPSQQHPMHHHQPLNNNNNNTQLLRNNNNNNNSSISSMAPGGRVVRPPFSMEQRMKPR